MKRLQRLLAGGIVGFGLALSMTAAPAAQAARGTTLYVNDMTSNDPSPTFCPATTHTSLQAAQTALGATKTNVTITICPGIYPWTTNAVHFDGFTNLKIQSKGSASLAANSMSGPLIWVSNSSKVTTTGLGISGGGALGSSQSIGIFYENTSGTISKNLIARWHQDFDSSPTTGDVGIGVITTSTMQKVVIDRNSILDVQTYGIMVNGPGKARITRNRVTFHNDLVLPAPVPPGPPVQAGILLYEAGPGVQVSKNLIEGNTGLEPKCGVVCALLDNNSRGIMMLQSSGAVIKGNKVNYVQQGISVESWCLTESNAPNEQLANGNIISGNTLYNNGGGVRILAVDYYSSSSCIPHADGNVVQSNKFIKDLTGSNRVRLSASSPATAAGNVVKNNKFYGYAAIPNPVGSSGDGVSGLVDTGNKIFPMPPVGAP